MHETVLSWIHEFHMLALLGVLVASIIGLGKGADWLVDEATTLSVRTGVPSVIVGATIVSLGTTAPEAFVSVLAAVNGNPSLALGNAVGSIICDTGLILGLACFLAPLPFNRTLVNRQGWIQFSCGVLLVLACLPWNSLATTFQQGGVLLMPVGWGFLLLLVVYLVWSVRQTGTLTEDVEEADSVAGTSPIKSILKLVVAIAIVVVSADFLIAAVEIIAERLKIPPEIIAATVVAFGTSLPELVTAMVAVKKNQGELAVGNVIGADILNVLFVAGAAASVTRDGLHAEPFFFQLQFPTMMLVLLVFRIAIFAARDNKLKRPFGLLLLAIYIVYLVINAMMIK